MSAETSSTASGVLRAAVSGDKKAAEQLLPSVYEELRKLARWRCAKLQPGETLQTTALVHEAYLKVVGNADPGWDGRGHFFGAAAQAMRDILVDAARRKAALKRGGDWKRQELNDFQLVIEAPCDDVFAVHEAIEALETDDERKGLILKLRVFAGLTVREVAELLKVSVGTVERDWRYITAWLRVQLSDESEGGDHE